MALAILVIIITLLQATFSAFQDWSTQKVMNSILDLLPSEASVLRDGKMVRLPASELVTGDVIHITIGNKVPADLRIITHSGDVRFDRSILTGEPDEIEGTVDQTDENFLESRNIAFMGTMVTNGNAIGVVVLTSQKSIMGRIAEATSGVKQEETLIQKEITRFVKIIVGLTIVLALIILIAWVAWLRVQHVGYMNVVAMLNDVMGCVVAFIPEGI
jgi:sodium/potassium-transporting ATPase subunit alpha